MRPNSDFSKTQFLGRIYTPVVNSYFNGKTTELFQVTCLPKMNDKHQEHVIGCQQIIRS